MRHLDVMPGAGGTPQPTWSDGAADLARAIHHPHESGGLTLAYQPQVDLESGQLIGVEALARWSHPTRGPVSPNIFVPMAERFGLIDFLGRWVLRRAVHDLTSWERVHPQAGGLRLAVNVACSQLRPGLAVDIQRITSRAALDPARLTLELTETLPLDPAQANPTLRGLRALGVRLSMDDFGTGYATFAHLRQIPVDQLKLDRTFVMAPHGPACDAIVSAIRMLAEELHLELIAEGVETSAEHDRLLKLGCRAGQGFLYARPMPSADLLALLAHDGLVQSPIGGGVHERAS